MENSSELMRKLDERRRLLGDDIEDTTTQQRSNLQDVAELKIVSSCLERVGNDGAAVAQEQLAQPSPIAVPLGDTLEAMLQTGTEIATAAVPGLVTAPAVEIASIMAAPGASPCLSRTISPSPTATPATIARATSPAPVAASIAPVAASKNGSLAKHSPRILYSASSPRLPQSPRVLAKQLQSHISMARFPQTPSPAPLGTHRSMQQMPVTFPATAAQSKLDNITPAVDARLKLPSSRSTCLSLSQALGAAKAPATFSGLSSTFGSFRLPLSTTSNVTYPRSGRQFLGSTIYQAQIAPMTCRSSSMVLLQQTAR